MDIGSLELALSRVDTSTSSSVGRNPGPIRTTPSIYLARPTLLVSARERERACLTRSLVDLLAYYTSLGLALTDQAFE